MAGDEEHGSSNKRRCSPSPPPDINATKRARLGDADNDDGGSRRRTSSSSITNASPQSPASRRRPSTSSRTTDVGHRRQQQPLAREPVGPPVKKPVTQEDKKRGQRLFGGILGTLSQTTTNSHLKKRAEIERRQQERLQKQQEEEAERKAKKLQRLKTEREVEQIRFEEEVMSTRHAHLLSRARMLQTKSEPRIYYSPWDLTREQERTIDKQISAAEEQLERELEEFRVNKERRLRELGIFSVDYKVETGQTTSDTKGKGCIDSTAEREEESNRTRKPSVDANNNRPPSRRLEPWEEMIVDEEDTIIY